MIAFFMINDKDSTEYWVHDIAMRPDRDDVIIGPDGDRYLVEFAILNFSERIGLHYGIIMSPFGEKTWRARHATTTNFVTNVTDDIFFNRQNLIVDRAVHFDE